MLNAKLTKVNAGFIIAAFMALGITTAFAATPDDSLTLSAGSIEMCSEQVMGIFEVVEELAPQVMGDTSKFETPSAPSLVEVGYFEFANLHKMQKGEFTVTKGTLMRYNRAQMGSYVIEE